MTDSTDGFIERDIVGTVLAGRYRIVEKLGEGAMGAVYLGEHLKIGRRDAIKILRDNLASDAEALARFNRGARNVSSIRHPNVCTIYDYSDTGDGHQFLAMEYIPGETLKDVLDREGTLPLGRAVEIARQVAEGLQAAHEVGVVHRDLKPANIMIVPGRNGEETVRVVDFDLAKGALDGEEAEVTRVGWVVGTPEYMSPEQLTGDRLEGSSDIYSLALVFYRMVTGTFPFRAGSTHEMLLQRLTEAPMPLVQATPGRSFPPGIQAAVDRALQRSSADRYADAAEFGRDLVLSLESAAATAGPPLSAPQDVDPLPQTRVFGALQSGSGRSGNGSPADADSAMGLATGAVKANRTSLLAGGLGALLVLGVAGAAALYATRGAEEVGLLASPGDSSPQTDQVEVEVADPHSDAADPEVQEFGPQEGVDATISDGPAGTTSTVAAASPADATEVPRPRTSASRPSAELAEVVLRDQRTRLLAATPPTRAGILAIRDTAEMLYSTGGISRSLRAQAAHMAGSMWLELGNPAECVRWLNLALAEDPSHVGYRNQLDFCRQRADATY